MALAPSGSVEAAGADADASRAQTSIVQRGFITYQDYIMWAGSDVTSSILLPSSAAPDGVGEPGGILDACS